MSSTNNNYNRDYLGELSGGGHMPSLNVCVKMLPDKGRNGRHLDMAWAVWNLPGFTPEGRGSDWFPRLRYE